MLDGGVYDNLDVTIRKAMDMVIADLKEPRISVVTEQYYRDEYLQGEVYASSEVEIVDYEETFRESGESGTGQFRLGCGGGIHRLDKGG